jgi:hypothetical protein
MSGTPQQQKLHKKLCRDIDNKRSQLAQLYTEIANLEDERERLALEAYGLKLGDKVILTGTRFKGREAVIVDAVCWTHGGVGGVTPTPLGEKPPILVNVPGTKATHFKVSGRLWERFGQ